MRDRAGKERMVMPVDSETLMRLRGDKCLYCGMKDDLRYTKRLEFTTDESGARYGWPVVVCAEHAKNYP